MGDYPEIHAVERLGEGYDLEQVVEEYALLRDALLTHGDYYMHLADLKSYVEAYKRLCELYTDSMGWSRKAILNVAGSGKFSSDRTIAEYATDIWHVESCPVSSSDNPKR